MSLPRSGDGMAVVLTGAGADVGSVGGKGAWTDRLIGAGFRVPPATVITTAAYDAVVADPAVGALIDETASAPAAPPPRHEELRRRLDAAFLEVDLPPGVSEALDRAEQEVRRPGGRLAARSSATAEDLHGTSFAGQYRSYLDVTDRAGLERCVRLVWASLWHPAPHAYRLYHGVDEGHLAMAVIVMHQVEATHAGVAFTVDPGGRSGCVRVETVTGAGEQLVSGRVTPDVDLVERDRTERGDGRAVAVAALALEAEERLGAGPLDLEWAEDGSGLWLLQARPVTGLADEPAGDGFDTVGWAERRWSTAGITEMVPGVLPPLRHQVCHLALEEAVRSHEDRVGNLPPEAGERALLGRVRGRAALDDELMELVRERAVSGGRWTGLRRSLTALRERRSALWEAGSSTVAAWEAWDRMPELATLGDRRLLSLRRRLIALACRAMSAEVAVASVAVASESRLEMQLRRHLEPGDARRWALRVTARPGVSVAGWPARELTEAFGSAPTQVVAAVAAAEDADAAATAVGSLPGGPELMESIDVLVRRAGSRAVLAGPTWDEEPRRWWGPVQQAAARAVRDAGDRDAGDVPVAGPEPADPSQPVEPTYGPLDELLDGLAANPDWTQDRIRTAQVIDLRRILIRRQAEEAADLLERRERAKAAVLTIGGMIRRIHLELGYRLVGAGVLEEPADVELLGEGELRTAVLGGAPVPPPAELARRRRWLAYCEEAGPLPATFEGSLPDEPPPAPGGDALQGWGAAPGRHRGHVRVLRDAGESDLHRGDVLVARTTDASWAPLFMVAGAVVVEEGGPLSHAAIVARELGIPAVVNVPGAVARLSDGPHEAVVDGDSGTVELVERS